MAESVDILIKADDKASAKINAVGGSLDGLSKRAREVGKQTKASTELFGTFANALGGTALGAFSRDMAQLTERMSNFSEVSKSGTLGVMAFKAGLIAAGAVVTYKITETIASWWFEIDKAKASADEAAKSFDRMAQSIEKAAAKRQAMEREDFSLIRDPAEREAAINKRAAELEEMASKKNIEVLQAQDRLRQLEAKARSEFKVPGVTSRTDADIEAAKDQLQDAQKRRDTIRAEADGLRELTSERTKSIEVRKQENAAAIRGDAFIERLRDEVQQLRAKRAEMEAIELGDADALANAKAMAAATEALRSTATTEQASEAEKLIRERELINEKIEAQREYDAERKRIEETEAKELANLEAKRIELEQGKEAARAFRLEQAGLSREAAQMIAREEARMDLQQKLKPDTTPQQALQGRLLTKGTVGNDPITKLVGVAEKTLNAIEKLTETTKTSYERQKSKSIILTKVKVA